MIVVGWLAYAAIYLGFGLAGAAWQIWALFALYGIYYGLAEGAGQATAQLIPVMRCVHVACLSTHVAIH
jgi:hypothetical protein